jgi:hypothetical protein
MESMMSFLRRHWFDVGLGLAAIVGLFLILHPMTTLSLLYWLSLISLFLHQFEEYRFPGHFPRMINTAMFASTQPDRFPLNANTALIINVTVGWLIYLLAALFGTKLLWLGMASILVSLGNVIAHTLLFNIKGKTHYTPGMITADVLFLPITVWFFILVIQNNLARPMDWVIGILLGIVLNYVGVLKLIDWLKNKETAFIFD